MPSLQTALGTEAIDVTGDGVKIGGATNHLDIALDGSLRARGAATMWKDMVANLFGKRLSSTVGKVDYDYDENTIVFQSGGNIATQADRVGGNQEINHEFKVGTSITFKPHIHWFQSAATAFVFTAQYRVQRNNAVKTTAWTSLTATVGTDDVFTYPGSGTFNQLTKFPDITIDCSISDTIQWQMTRTDALTGDAHVYFFDIHGEVDSLGSEEEISKEV